MWNKFHTEWGPSSIERHRTKFLHPGCVHPCPGKPLNWNPGCDIAGYEEGKIKCCGTGAADLQLSATCCKKAKMCLQLRNNYRSVESKIVGGQRRGNRLWKRIAAVKKRDGVTAGFCIHLVSGSQRLLCAIRFHFVSLSSLTWARACADRLPTSAVKVAGESVDIWPWERQTARSLVAIFIACVVVRRCSSRACGIVVIVVILWLSCLCDEGLCRHDVSSDIKWTVDIVFRSLRA